MGLIYAFVARSDGTCLAEHYGAKGNFSQVATECMQHVSKSGDSRLTIACDKHTFNFYKTTEWLYLAVADEAFGRQVPYAYLERIAEAWEGDFARRAQRAGPHSFNRSFGPRLKEQMDFLNANPEAINRVAAVQRKVEDVKSVMVENIDKVVLRGERIQLLVEAAEELEASANQFRKQGRALRQQFWWQNVKTKVAVVGGISLILAFILVFCICFAGANRCVPNKTGR